MSLQGAAWISFSTCYPRAAELHPPGRLRVGHHIPQAKTNAPTNEALTVSQTQAAHRPHILQGAIARACVLAALNQIQPRHGSWFARVGPATPRSPLAAAAPAAGRPPPPALVGRSRSSAGSAGAPGEASWGQARPGRASIPPPTALWPHRLTSRRGSSKRPGPALPSPLCAAGEARACRSGPASPRPAVGEPAAQERGWARSGRCRLLTEESARERGLERSGHRRVHPALQRYKMAAAAAAQPALRGGAGLGPRRRAPLGRGQWVTLLAPPRRVPAGAGQRAAVLVSGLGGCPRLRWLAAAVTASISVTPHRLGSGGLELPPYKASRLRVVTPPRSDGTSVSGGLGASASLVSGLSSVPSRLRQRSWVCMSVLSLPDASLAALAL